MQCPICNERLRELDKAGILIDICPQCRGAWLDRAELEKVMAALAPGISDPNRQRGHDDHDSDWDDHRDRRRTYDDDHQDHGHNQGYGKGRGRRREGILGNIMDMFGD